MGYSHYWRRPKELDAEKFKEFASDIKKIIEMAEKDGIMIKGGSGKGLPEITNDTVSFNGDIGLDGEMFRVDRIEKKPLSDVDIRLGKEDEDVGIEGMKGLYFKYCKTLLMPYDIVVVAALVSLKYRFPEVKITSRSLQKDGILLAEKALGISFENIEKMLRELNSDDDKLTIE